MAATTCFTMFSLEIRHEVMLPSPDGDFTITGSLRTTETQKHFRFFFILYSLYKSEASCNLWFSLMQQVALLAVQILTEGYFIFSKLQYLLQLPWWEWLSVNLEKTSLPPEKKALKMTPIIFGGGGWFCKGRTLEGSMHRWMTQRRLAISRAFRLSR